MDRHLVEADALVLGPVRQPLEYQKKSFSESGQGSRVGWSLTTPEVHGTQVAHLSCDDH